MAWTRTSTYPRFSSGIGIGSYRSTCGPPNACSRIACIMCVGMDFPFWDGQSKGKVG